MAKKFGFGNKEKLKSRKLIEELFTSGKSFPVFPLRIVYRLLPAEQGSIHVGFSASKRYFKKAVDRNRLKRLMREAYRLQKLPLVEKLQELNLELHVFFMFNGKVLVNFEEVKSSMKKGLDQLQKKLVNENLS